MQTKKTKRFLSVFLSMLIVSSVFFGAKADAIKQRAITYTALGDSISTGYKLSNTSKDYVNLFGKYLNTVPVNLGKNGLDSAGLLGKLNQDQTVIGQIKKSDVITVSMGGNDMLVIFSSLNLDLTSPLSLVNAVSLLQGNTLHRKLTGGVESFRKNWPKIVARLKNLAPDANLVVTTLINPYQGIVLKVPLLLNFDLGAFSEPYIRQINSVIKKDAKGNYQVADSYSMFQSEKKLKLTNANLNDYNFDPHPNVSGHNLIYQAHRSVPIRFSRNALKILGADQVTIPYSLTPGVTACAKYSAQSLLSCLAPDDTALRSVYTIADSGSTGAVISPSGELTVKNPGTVRIKAVLSSSKSNLSVEGVKTVTVKRENPPKRSFLDGKLPMIAAIFAIAVVAVILLVRKFKKKKRKN